MGPGARQAVAILVAMVVLLATGLVPPAIAGLLAAGAIVLSGIMSVEQSYRAIDWTTVILVGAMMPLSTAMVETGAAKLMAEHLVALVGEAGPIALLAGLFILTAIMGQLISNTATALIVIPIGVAAATAMGISPRPVLMSTAVSAAAAFLTPIATPTNLMVMGPGGYAFGDYWKLGLPLLHLVLCRGCVHSADDLAILSDRSGIGRVRPGHVLQTLYETRFSGQGRRCPITSAGCVLSSRGGPTSERPRGSGVPRHHMRNSAAGRALFRGCDLCACCLRALHHRDRLAASEPASEPSAATAGAGHCRCC